MKTKAKCVVHKIGAGAWVGYDAAGTYEAEAGTRREIERMLRDSLGPCAFVRGDDLTEAEWSKVSEADDEAEAPEEAEDRDGVLFEFDAEDLSGNEAGQETFEMELNEEGEVEDEVPATTTTPPNYLEMPLEEKVNGLRPLYADSKQTLIWHRGTGPGNNWDNINYQISDWDGESWIKGSWYTGAEIYNSYDFRLIGLCSNFGLGGVEIFAGHNIDIESLYHRVQILGEETTYTSAQFANETYHYASGSGLFSIVNKPSGPQSGRSVLVIPDSQNEFPEIRFILTIRDESFIVSDNKTKKTKDVYDVIVQRARYQRPAYGNFSYNHICGFDVTVMGTFTDESLESFKSKN